MEASTRQAIAGKYVLQPWVLDVIKKKAVRRKLSAVLGVIDITFLQYIKKNSDNLTKLAAMEEIKKLTGKVDEKDLVMVNPVWKKDNELQHDLFQ